MQLVRQALKHLDKMYENKNAYYKQLGILGLYDVWQARTTLKRLEQGKLSHGPKRELCDARADDGGMENP
jgi:hypothetical protein